MSADDGQEAAHVEQLLAAARSTALAARHCWIATVGEDGAPHARVVSQIPGVPGEDAWTVWFLTSKASRKAAEIRRDARVTVGYQHDPDSAYAAFGGRAVLLDDPSELASRWNPAWNAVFPAGADDPDAVFVKIEVERIELWNLAFKVTPAPFGKRAAVLRRTGSGPWAREP
ncbi:MAG: pyridoxamine 5'-phosphate oxidase family protein [Pseudomonadota bacterium]